MRDGNPRNMQNWELVCSGCAHRWGSSGETFEDLEQHFKDDHPDVEGLHLTWAWIGKGPAPKKAPELPFRLTAKKPKRRRRR